MSGNQYTWEFVSLDTMKTDTVDNVVYNVHWVLTAADTINEVSASTFGVVRVAPYVDGQPFIPFQELTPTIVQSWVESAMGLEKVADLKSKLDGEIEEKKNPKTFSLLPPWVQTSFAG